MDGDLNSDAEWKYGKDGTYRNPKFRFAIRTKVSYPQKGVELKPTVYYEVYNSQSLAHMMNFSDLAQAKQYAEDNG